MPRRNDILLAGLLVLGTGCAVRKPQTYRLKPPVLVPPGLDAPSWSRLKVVPDVRSGRGPCSLTDPAIEIRRRGKFVQLNVSREPLRQRPPGWLSGWAAAAEEQGCIGKGESLKLAARIAESLPLNPAAAWQLLYPSDVRAGYVDLGPETRLEVVGPIMRQGAAPDAPIVDSATIKGLTVEVKVSRDLAGFEKCWFALRPRPDGVGSSVVPTGCERTVAGKTETAAEPSVDYLHFPPEAAFYRLFYKADRTIAVVYAPTRAELDRRGDDGKHALLVPRNVALNPNVAVTVNGRDTLLPVGSNLRRAIYAEEKKPETVLPRLTVQKPYRGRLVPVEFNPGTADILNLVLTGGEVLAWRPVSPPLE